MKLHLLEHPVQEVLVSSRLAGVTFRIAKVEDGTHYLDRTTDANGEIIVSDLEPGVYSVVETAAPDDHIPDLSTLFTVREGFLWFRKLTV